MSSFYEYFLITENTHPFYIQKGFPDDIKNFILNYKTTRSPRCHVESARWYLRLTKEFNVDPNRIKIAVGYYSDSFGDADNHLKHYWLVVDKKYIFDPTSFQFTKNPSYKKYISSKRISNPQEWSEKNSKEFSSIYD